MNFINHKKPNFFIIGAPKCGTTSLVHYLSQHPEIFLYKRKSPHFFADDLKFFDRRMSSKEYFELFKNVGNEKIIGEKSAWYLFSKNAAHNIYNFNKKSKLLVILRNPVYMIHSLHTHQFNRESYGNYLKGGRVLIEEDIQRFEKALKVQQDRKQGKKIPKHGRFREQLYYFDVAKFSDQIDRYFKYFTKDQLYIVLLEDLKANPNEIIRNIYNFLEVDTTFNPKLDQQHNPSRILKSNLFRKLYTSFYSSALFRYILPYNTHISLVKKASKFNHKKGKPILKEETRLALEKKMKPEVEKLSQMLDRDLLKLFNFS
ncbi:MAG: sulfotransferase family protein [Candidatus Woesearchaeota archaeon]